MDLFLAVLFFAFSTTITPGPNNVMIMSSGVNYGIKASVPHWLGICLGFPLMVLLVGLGFGVGFERYPHLQGLEFVEQVLDYFNFSYAVRDNELERIPSSGRVVIIANHPIGSLDGLALLKLVSEIRPDVKVLANQLLMALPPLHSLLLPVNNMSGGTERRRLDAIGAHLAANHIAADHGQGQAIFRDMNHPIQIAAQRPSPRHRPAQGQIQSAPGAHHHHRPCAPWRAANRPAGRQAARRARRCVRGWLPCAGGAGRLRCERTPPAVHSGDRRR